MSTEQCHSCDLLLLALDRRSTTTSSKVPSISKILLSSWKHVHHVFTMCIPYIRRAEKAAGFQAASCEHSEAQSA